MKWEKDVAPGVEDVADFQVEDEDLNGFFSRVIVARLLASVTGIGNSFWVRRVVLGMNTISHTQFLVVWTQI